MSADRGFVFDETLPQWDERRLLLSMRELRQRLRLDRPVREVRAADYLHYALLLTPVFCAAVITVGGVWWLLG